MLHKTERALNTDAFISSKVRGKIAAPFFNWKRFFHRCVDHLLGITNWWCCSDHFLAVQWQSTCDRLSYYLFFRCCCLCRGRPREQQMHHLSFFSNYFSPFSLRPYRISIKHGSPRIERTVSNFLRIRGSRNTVCSIGLSVIFENVQTYDYTIKYVLFFFNFSFSTNS